MTTPADMFRSAILETGLKPPTRIEPGRFVRFPGQGKNNGNRAGWAYLFPDGRGGVFGDWSRDISETWQADKKDWQMTPEERAALQRQVAEAKAKAAAERARQHEKAERRTAKIWDKAKPAPSNHPYLLIKGVKPYGLRLYHGDLNIKGMPRDGSLIVPARNIHGVLQTLDFIHPEKRDGDNKRFLPGGDKKGNYFAIGKPDGVLCICEGYATGASIHEATGHAVALAFDAGNLLPAARALREKFPDLKLIVCADNDIKGEEMNVGVEKATAAAKAVGGFVAVPEMDGQKCDFNDLAQAKGPEAVRACIEKAAAQNITGVTLIDASSLTMQPIQWIWPGWLAANKLHIIAGAPGTGKTMIALSMAATITRGGVWPDGTRCLRPGNVLIWSGEDDPADTLLPRLVAAGADLTRIKFVGTVQDGEEARPFDPAKDMRVLEVAAKDLDNLRLLICDPVVLAVRGDSHKNAEVRRGLQPLVDFGQRHGAAVLGVSHFSKGTAGREPLERVCGSLAFGALARIVWGTVKDKQDPDKRLLVRMKSNIGVDGGGFSYSLSTIQLENDAVGLVIRWGDIIVGEARFIIGTAEDQENSGTWVSALEDASAFLEDLLASGPLPAQKVKAEAIEAGYSLATIRRAKNRLGIKPQKIGGAFGQGKDNQQWVWRLPES